MRIQELKIIRNSLSTLENWCRSHNYEGWDIYDGLNNPKFKFKIGNPYLSIFLIQFNKYSPLNFRKVLGIKKGKDLKGLSLFLQGYSLLYSLEKKNIYKKIGDTLLKDIINKSLIDKYNNHCWSSHYYPYISTEKELLSPNIPDIIGTANVIKALSFYYIYKKEDPQIPEIIKSSLDFMTNKLFYHSDDIAYIAYTPKNTKRIVPNASAVVVDALSSAYEVLKDPHIISLSNELITGILKLQLTNGSWPYSVTTPDRKVRYQHDFHQGFIINGLISSLSLLDESIKENVLKALYRAIEFYKTTFIGGQIAYFRYPKRYPIDIHNQAQGIITFSKLYKTFGNIEYLKFAKKIAIWTIKNMQDPSGYFYTHRWPFMINKIPYMRWGQAWMLLALSSLLTATSKKGGWDL